LGRLMTRSALLYILGAVLFALVTGRMEAMQAEVAVRPMRSFALGVVTSLGFLVMLGVLCVTIIGIPIAIVLILLAFLAAYAGVCAVLTTVGKALIGHKTSNVYLHLALGCALFLVAGALPWIGKFVTLALIMISAGLLVSTKFGQLRPAIFSSEPSVPYRSV
jgi:hypothetical protein